MLNIAARVQTMRLSRIVTSELPCSFCSFFHGLLISSRLHNRAPAIPASMYLGARYPKNFESKIMFAKFLQRETAENEIVLNCDR